MFGRPRRSARGAFLVTLWLAFALGGMGWLDAYASVPGDTGTPPAGWPARAGGKRDPSRFTLLLALHPACSCSRATIEELSRLIARLGKRLAVRVFVVRESGLVLDSDSGSIEAAARLPGVELVEDPDGRLARSFGAETSGFAVLYDPSGVLRFSGGLTASRGHVGENEGSRAIRALVLGERTTPGATAVFGCDL